MISAGELKLRRPIVDDGPVNALRSQLLSSLGLKRPANDYFFASLHDRRQNLTLFTWSIPVRTSSRGLRYRILRPPWRSRG